MANDGWEHLEENTQHCSTPGHVVCTGSDKQYGGSEGAHLTAQALTLGYISTRYKLLDTFSTMHIVSTAGFSEAANADRTGDRTRHCALGVINRHVEDDVNAPLPIGRSGYQL